MVFQAIALLFLAAAIVLGFVRKINVEMCIRDRSGCLGGIFKHLLTFRGKMDPLPGADQKGYTQFILNGGDAL